MDLTLDTLSAKSGIHATTISQIESGRRLPPERPDVARIADALDLAPASPEYKRLIDLAESERSERRKRRRSELGQLRRVVVVGQDQESTPTSTDPQPGPEIPVEDHSGILARALKELLDLELREGIAKLEITTRTGQMFVISMTEGVD